MSKRNATQAGFRQGRKSGNVKRRRYSTRRSNATQATLLRRKMQIEKKGFDTILGSHGGTSGYLDTTGTNGDIYPLNMVSPGNGSWQRVGKKLLLQSIRIQGQLYSFTQNNMTYVTGNTVRMIVVYDKQPSGNIPIFSDIFGRTSQTGVGETEDTRISDPLRFDNTNRFRILRDITYDMNPMSSGDDGDFVVTYQTVDEYIKLNNLETQYSGQSVPTTQSDISSGGLYVIFRASNDVPTVSYALPRNLACRLRYYD